MKKQYFLFLAIAFFFILAIVLLITYFLTNKGGGSMGKGSPTPFPVPTNISADYSKINLLRPGKSNTGDVERILGFPSSTKTQENKIYFYYKTPAADYQNVVLMIDGVVYYAIENVFGKYRGTYSDYIASYGKSDIHLLNKNANSFEWDIFLKQGIGIESTNNYITRVLYFTPTTKSVFMGFLANDIGLTATPIQPPFEEANPAP